jgi:hypothetical protein
MAQTFDIPVDVPWSFVAASPDMMDVGFNDGGFPPPWRSSLAIYAYEPPAQELPQQLCNQKITYLKVTCSITGYQPTASEIQALAALTPPPGTVPPPGSPDSVEVALPNAPADVIEDLIHDYYACYGVLLQVAVFPSVSALPAAATAAHQQYQFSGTPRPLPNPFSDAGLEFSVPPGGSLDLVQLSPTAPLALAIRRTYPLQITLPPSTNIVLTMTIRNRMAKGTITAYQGDQEVFSLGELPKGDSSPQNVPIATPTPVTRIVVQLSAEECFLDGLSFDLQERELTLGDYPHIVDFEPKTRDLYQAATDQGEILTASTSALSTGKSKANTASSEMGLGLNASVGGKVEGVEYNVGGSLTGKWGNTATDSSNTQADQSRERRETQGTTTSITQQYNLLTGYHAGTNRAAFLMLPRPHTLQATDYRTFVRGLRMIEGVQEFFLIVSRPTAVPGICIESSLETGHFPENVALAPPPVTTPPSQVFHFPMDVGGPGGNAPELAGKTYTETLSIAPPPPWIVDTTQTSNGQQWPGVLVKLVPKPLVGDPNDFTQALAENTLTLTGTTLTASVKTGGPFSSIKLSSYQAAYMQVEITVWATQEPSDSVDSEPKVVSPFLVTSRTLAACIDSCPVDDCMMVVPTELVTSSDRPPAAQASGGPEVMGSTGAASGSGGSISVDAPETASDGSSAAGATALSMPPKAPTSSSSIVYESQLKLPGHLLGREQLQKSRTPVARELMHQIRNHMLGNWRLPQRRAHGSVGFVDSDYVAHRLAGQLPEAKLSLQLAAVPGLPSAALDALGATSTVGDALKLELHALSTRAKVGLADAVLIRRRLLAFASGAGEGHE